LEIKEKILRLTEIFCFSLAMETELAELDDVASCRSDRTFSLPAYRDLLAFKMLGMYLAEYS